MASKKAILQMMDGKRVKREYLNMATIEDIDSMREEIKKSLLEEGHSLDVLEEDERTFSFKGSTQFIFKPCRQNGEGVFKLRSKDYTFTIDGGEPSYGDIPKGGAFKPLENGFISVHSIEEGHIVGVKYTLCL